MAGACGLLVISVLWCGFLLVEFLIVVVVWMVFVIAFLRLSYVLAL